jgi:phage replication-related protein YjqB (UPF0714/DUF867 family)
MAKCKLAMTNKYDNYNQLSRSEEINKDYRIQWRKGKTSTAIIAVHGGGIEPGTTEIADAIAENEHSFYTFEGIKPIDNGLLHITSANFDEPNGVDVVKESTNVLALHGCDGEADIVYLGGLDPMLKRKIKNALIQAGFKTSEHNNPELQGIHVNNICNRGKERQGVQMEISADLRKKMLRSLKAKDRNEKTALFEDFVLAVREAFISD